ncbi:MAG: single-stranded DNA-binding protein [Proteobacteria bacterium]|nr:single-stranded DNA-binding protein [Pseudomonadota bacterium]
MINKATIIGNLGADPEIKETENMVIANLRIATNEKWKDKSGQKQERTEWHRVVFFGRTAEVCRDYLRKGSSVFVEGRIQTDKYEKDGEPRYSTKIMGREMKMLDAKSSKTESDESDGDFDDDIPF